jgi:hypothetical protein
MPKYVINPDGSVLVSGEDVVNKSLLKDPINSKTLSREFINSYFTRDGKKSFFNSAMYKIESINELEFQFGGKSDQNFLNFYNDNAKQNFRDLTEESANVKRVESESRFIDAIDLNVDNSFAHTKVKSKNLVNDSHNFEVDVFTLDNNNNTVKTRKKLLAGKRIETIMNFNSTGGDQNIFASEIEIEGGIPTNSFRDGEMTFKKLFLVFQILSNAIVHIVAAEAIFSILSLIPKANENIDIEENFHITFGENGHIDWTAYDAFIFKRLNYPRNKIRGFADIDERISAFIIGFTELIAGDIIFDIKKADKEVSRKEKFKRNIQSKYGELLGINQGVMISGLIGSTLHHLTRAFSTITQTSIKRLMLIERKIGHQNDWVSNLYKSKEVDLKDSAGLNIDNFLNSMKYYFFKFVIERMHIGLKIIRYYEFGASYDTHFSLESSYNRVGLSQSGDKSNSFVTNKTDNYRWDLKNSGNKISQSTRIRALPQAFIMPESAAAYLLEEKVNFGTNNQISKGLLQNFSIANEGIKRLSSDLVKSIETYLDSEYMPFYFHDLRTNEIIAFHAFIDNISDSFSPEYTTHSGFGRIDDVKHYVKTTRNISLSFTIAATSKEDHELMWYQINKIVSMVYPQYSEGLNNPNIDQLNSTYPFTQIPTNSPLIRLRVGDVIKSNYSDKNLARKFGANKIFNAALKTASSASSKENITYSALETEFNDARINRLASDSQRKEYQSNNTGEKDSKAIKKLVTNKIFYLMPGLYRVESNSVGSGLLSVLGFGEGKQYIHIKKYEKIKSSDDLSKDKEEVSYHAVTLTNKEYENVNFIVDSYSIIEKESPIPYVSSDTAKKAEYNNAVKSYNVTTSKLFNVSTNPVLQSYQSTIGKGLAGFITNLDINYNEQLWETADEDAKAPQVVKVTISYSPIHDIPLGLDSEGMLTSAAYNVGSLNKALFSSPYNTEDFKVKKEASVKEIERSDVPAG